MGTSRDRSVEIVEMLECGPTDFCCLQKTRYKGNSVRVIIGKAAVNKLFWIGNENCLGGTDVFLAEIRADEVID